MLAAKFTKRARYLALAAVIAMPTDVHAGRFGDMIGGGLNAARSVGGSVAGRASQGLGAARSVARRGTDVARTAASRSVGVARSAASQGAVVARSAASRGVGVAQNVAGRSVGVAQNVASRGVGAAQNVTARGINVAQNVASRGVGVAQNVATRGVNVVGSAANRARLAQDAIQNRLNPGGAVQNIAGVGNGAVATGVARFASATQIGVGAPQGIVAGNGAGLAQLRSGLANRTQNVLNVAAAIPPRVVNGAGQVAQAAGLPALPTRLKQAVNDAASLPQLAANIPVGAIVKSKVRDLGSAVGQGQVLNKVAAAGQQALAGNGLVGDALHAAGQIQQAVVDPTNVVANNGGLIDAALAASDLAAGIVETVDATQPDLLAAATEIPIPAGAVRSIVARPVSGGGGAAFSAPATEFVDYAPLEEAPFEETPLDAAPNEVQQTFAADPAAAELSNADLVLEDLQLAAHATAIAGPAYRLQFRNQGSTAATDFYVVLLAGVGATPAEDAPRAVLHVASVAPGEAVEAILRLPASAMQMVDATGVRQEMTHVFVSLDFTDAIVEIDETNNLAIVDAVALTTAMQ